MVLKNLDLLKQKGACSYEYMNSFERFKEKNCLLDSVFLALQKKEKIDDDDKISDSNISFKNYLKCEKVWDKFDMKDMGDYHNHYLKKDVLLLAVFEKFIDTSLKF